jgi:hypothetical protein
VIPIAEGGPTNHVRLNAAYGRSYPLQRNRRYPIRPSAKVVPWRVQLAGFNRLSFRIMAGLFHLWLAEHKPIIGIPHMGHAATVAAQPKRALNAAQIKSLGKLIVF